MSSSYLPATVTTPDGTTLNYQYAPRNLMTHLTYSYDSFGNMTTMEFTERQGGTYTTAYQYDNGDHITQTTLPSGRVIDYSRDGIRRINGITTTLNQQTQTILSDIRYRGDSQMEHTGINGLEDNRSYDLQGRLISQQLADVLNNIIDQRTYSYDKNSNILNIDTNTEDNGYVYDRLDRLTSDSIDDNNPFTYSYDLNDNRLSRQQGAGTEELDEWIDIIDNSNQIAQIGTLQRGAILSDLPDREMIYNDVGRLYQLLEANILKSEYIYNDMGQRTRKTIYQSDGTTVDSVTIYHYDQMGMLVTETTERGVLMKDYVWNGGVIAAQITNTVSLDESNTESIIYLYTDHLMTNRLATDDNQQVVWRWEGEAFGNTPAEELGGVSINLRFPGQYFDAESGWFYNYFRYYDPQLGRYITSDPIGLKAGTNTYNYVGSNPTTYKDRLGLFSPWGIAWELGCSAYNSATSDARDAWDNNVRDVYGSNKDIYNGIYERGIVRCIEEYQYHKDDCILDECISKVSDQNKKRSEENEKFLREGLDNNPWRYPPLCISRKPKPKPKPKPN